MISGRSDGTRRVSQRHAGRRAPHARGRIRREPLRGSLDRLRQLIAFALEQLQKREAFDAYRSGRITLREFTRALGLDIWAAHNLLRSENVPVAQGERMQTRAALEAALQRVTKAPG
jgi:hypothetical protein